MRSARFAWMARGLVLAVAVVALACSSRPKADDEVEVPPPIEGQPVSDLPGHESLQDNTAKEGPRLLPPEVYLRTYIRMFGEDLTPLEVEEIARGEFAGAVFDRWRYYLGALGFPDYKIDVARHTQTNALMQATFERLGIAMCVRTVEIELGPNAPPIGERRVYAFDPTPTDPTQQEFAERFDVLHRTFLSYPAHLAETDRIARYYELYQAAVAAHRTSGSGSEIGPVQAGWAAICYGLVRHPEFLFY